MLFYPITEPFGWYFFFVFLTSVYSLLLSASNILFLRVATRRTAPKTGPKVSVLVPARNEEDRLESCITSLLDQAYDNYEILILDDNSEDGTWKIIEGFAASNERVRGIQGKELPTDWNGKPHAMQQLAEAADGDILLFTDADTHHTHKSIPWVVANMEHQRADVLSGYAYERAESFGEVLVIPNLYLATTLFLPLWLVTRTKIKYFAHAIGQFIAFRKDAFSQIGGYREVRREVGEDIHIARYAKARGLRVAFLDAATVVSCRMYEGFRNAVKGIAKNIFDFFDKKVYPIVILSVFVGAFMLAPPVVLAVGAAVGAAWASWLALGVGLFFVTWAAVVYERRMPWYTPFFYPVLFVLILVIAWQSAADSLSGKGYEWKGRIVK